MMIRDWLKNRLIDALLTVWAYYSSVEEKVNSLHAWPIYDLISFQT